MSDEDIRQMALKCGLTINGYVMLGVEHFARLVVSAERDRCAKLAEDCVNIEKLADDIRNGGDYD